MTIHKAEKEETHEKRKIVSPAAVHESCISIDLQNRPTRLISQTILNHSTMFNYIATNKRYIKQTRICKIEN